MNRKSEDLPWDFGCIAAVDKWLCPMILRG